MNRPMLRTDFAFDLPQELIAQHPLDRRDSSRLLCLDRRDGSIRHRHFHDIPELLRPGDLLIMNDSRVLPSRLLGHREGTGGAMELLLLEQKETDLWETLARPGKKAKPGTRLVFGDGLLTAQVVEVIEGGNRLVRFRYQGNSFFEVLDRIGQMPLPPYITEKLEDKERYQTVYSREPGSAAAPTAGLHFTPELLDRGPDRLCHPSRGAGDLPACQGGEHYRPPHAPGALHYPPGDSGPGKRRQKGGPPGHRRGHHLLPHPGIRLGE